MSSTAASPDTTGQLDSTLIGPNLKPLPRFIPGSSETVIQKIDNQKLAQKFSTIWQWCDRYRKPITREIMNCYGQYHGNVPELGREAWQSNVNIPVPTQEVDVASARIMSNIFSSDDYFTVLGQKRSDELPYAFARNATRWQVERPGNMQSFKDALKDSLICGSGYLKIHFRQTLRPTYRMVQKPANRPFRLQGFKVSPTQSTLQAVAGEEIIGELRMESIPPVNVWADPMGRFVIILSQRTMSDLMELSEDVRDPETKQIVRPAPYIREEVLKVKPGMRDVERERELGAVRRDFAFQRDGAGASNLIDVYEFWGDFPDPDTGNLLFKNCFATFVNRAFTIRRPQRIPLFSGRIPLVGIRPKTPLHMVYGVGILQHNLSLQDGINRHANVLLDKAQMGVPMWEYDPLAHRDGGSAFRGSVEIRPGKLWPTKPGRTIFKAVQNDSGVTESDMMLLDRLLQWRQYTSYVDEFVTGAASTTGRKTKGEVDAKSSLAAQNFNEMAVQIQEACIGPILKTVYDTILQFQNDFTDEDLVKMFSDRDSALQFLTQMSGMSPEERWDKYHLDQEFKAVGVTNAMTRQQRLQNLQGLSQAFAADPMMNMLIDKREQAKQFVELFDQEPWMVLPQADAILQAAQSAAIQQMMNQIMGPPPGQQGAGPPPPGQPGPSGPMPGPNPQQGPPPSVGALHGANPHNAQQAAAAGAQRHPGGPGTPPPHP